MSDIISEEVRFTQSARKHHIGRAHVFAAMEAAGDPVAVPASGGQADDRLVWVGPDDRGIELEVIGVRTPAYLLIIHVMPTALRRPQ